MMSETTSIAATEQATKQRTPSTNGRHRQGEHAMNWDVISGQWKQLKGKAQQRWGKLSDSDWDRIEGKREQLVGRLQELYGKQKDEAERDIDDWGRGLH
jgi:uncharacterized protein YjbJ (UPF0337 family)